MTKLSVNINKIATLRNARGGDMPNVIQAAIDCQRFGAQGITVHPRPDGRHIRYQDVYDLRPIVSTEFNIEGNPTESFIELVLKVRPEQVTLVPDAHDAITSNAGFNTIVHQEFLSNIVSVFKKARIRTSIFVDPDPLIIEHAALTGTDRIELYTEPFAILYPSEPKASVQDFITAAHKAHQLGLGINAGHDLSALNLNYFIKNVPHVAEVSIGHALICDALYDGLEKTIAIYKQCLK